MLFLPAGIRKQALARPRAPSSGPSVQLVLTDLVAKGFQALTNHKVANFVVINDHSQLCAVDLAVSGLASAPKFAGSLRQGRAGSTRLWRD